MRIFRGFEEVRGIRNPVVTTGSFDGVHIGHKTILNRLRMLASKHDGESVLITFYPHPRKVLYPDTAGKNLKLINTQEEKLELLRKAGLDNVIIVEFTRDFSRITSEEFVRDYLHSMLKAKVIVVGFNHHFGFNQEGDYRHLWNWRKKYKFEAEEIPEQEVQHETVSSTKIRNAIREGYIQRANAYLDHYYIVMGTVTDNSPPRIADNIHFVRMPVTEESKLLPSPGLYAVSLVAEKAVSKAMAFITRNESTAQELFINIFENEESFCGERTSVLFHKKIHGALSPDDLHFEYRLGTARDEISELIY